VNCCNKTVSTAPASRIPAKSDLPPDRRYISKVSHANRVASAIGFSHKDVEAYLEKQSSES